MRTGGRLLRGLLIWLGGLAAGLLILALILNFISWNWARPYVGRLAEAKLGRAVTIAGPFAVHLFPWFWVEARDIHVANPAWANRDDMLEIGHIRIALAPWDLLRGHLHVKDFELDDSRLDLEKKSDQANWRFPGLTQDRGHAALPKKRAHPPSASPIVIDRFSIRNFTLDYQREAARLVPVHVEKLAGSLPRDLAAVRIASRGTVAGLPYTLQVLGQSPSVPQPRISSPGASSGRATSGQTGTTSPPASLLDFRLPGMQLRIDGSLVGLMHGTETAYVHLASTDAASILKRLGFASVSPPSFDFRAAVARTSDAWMVPRMSLSTGKSRISGWLSYATSATSTSHPLLTVALDAQQVYYDDLKGFVPQKTSKARTRSRPLQAPPTASTRQPLPDADVQLRIAQLYLPWIKGHIADTHVHARLERGHLFLNEARLAVVDATGVVAHAFAAGHADKPRTLDDVSLRFRAEGHALSPLLAAFDLDVGAIPPYKIEGHLTRTGHTFALRDFHAHAGQSVVQGRGSIVLGPRPTFTVDLKAPLLRYRDLAPFLPTRPKAEARPSAASSRKAKGHWQLSDKPLPFSLLTRADGVVHLDVDRFVAPSQIISLANAHLDTRLDHGVLSIHDLQLSTNQGRLGITGNIDTRTAIPTVWLVTAVNGVRVGRLVVPVTKKIKIKDLRAPDLIQAHVGGLVRVATAGNTLRDLVANSHGSASLYTQDGYISSLAIEVLGIDVTESLATWFAAPSPETRINCMYANFQIDNGIISTDNVLLGTGKANLRLDGSVNLVSGKMALKIRDYPKNISIGSLRAPIDIHGNIVDAKVHPDYRVVALKAVTAVALGVFVNPLAAVVPLIEPAPAERGVCITYEDDIASVRTGVERVVGGRPTEAAH